jgi:hypothetical protein
MLNHKYITYFLYILLLCPIYPKYYDNSLSNNLEEKYKVEEKNCESALHINIKTNDINEFDMKNLPKKIKPKEIIID